MSTKYVVVAGYYGARDSHDEFIPYDQHGYSQAEGMRGLPGSLWDQFANEGYSRGRNNLNPLQPLNASDFANYTYPDGTLVAQREWAFPSEISDRLSAFNVDRDLAVIANVGTLLDPLTAEEYENNTKLVPGQIAAHNIQQKMIQSGAGEVLPTGWVGRILENLARKNSTSDANRRFEAVSITGTTSDLPGPRRQYFVSGVSSPPTVDDVFNFNTFPQDNNARLNMRAIMTSNYDGQGTKPSYASESWVSNYVADLMQRADEINREYLVALANLSLAIQYEVSLVQDNLFPGSRQNLYASLASQYEAICRIIAINENEPDLLGNPQQIVFVTQLGGWDDHDMQAGNFNVRQSIDNAVLNDYLIENFKKEVRDTLGVYDRFIFAPWSDFSRTLWPNNDGTDHAWGQNLMPWGGPVNGGRIYWNTSIPSWDDVNDPYVTLPGRGLWVPTISIEQYFGTIGSWLGLTEQELMYGVGGTSQSPASDAPFPNLSNMNNYQDTSSKLVPWVSIQ